MSDVSSTPFDDAPDRSGQRPNSPRQQPGALAKGTLGRRLVVRVIALISATALALSALSLVVIYMALLGQKEADIIPDVRDQFRAGTVQSRTLQAPREPRTIVVKRSAAGSTDGAIVTSEGIKPLDADIRLRLLDLAMHSGSGPMHTVTLPNLGTYYLWVGQQEPEGKQNPGADNGTEIRPDLVVVGRPLAGVHQVLSSMALALLGLALLAILVSVFAVRSLVISSLRPLNRLAGTADQVAETQLESGDAGLTVRVDEDDANPNNEVGRVGAAFNRMLEHVDRALAARQASETKVRQFVADASHELRNPLAAIRGYAEITRRQRDDIPPDSAFAMARIEAESERMSSLVEDMLLLARLDNKPELDLESVDLKETLEHAVSDARAAGPDHIWQVDLPSYEMEGIVQRHRFYQVIVNLLTNARVHTPPGTVVTGILRKNGDRAVITIHDNGPGVPKEMQSKVFERFVRADAARARMSSASTGLGLAIVASVIEAHGGTVRCEGDVGNTNFIIEVPMDGPFIIDDDENWD